MTTTQAATSSSPSTESTAIGKIIALTDQALVQFRQTIAETPGALGIQMAVTGGGCAGLQYDMKACTEIPQGFL
ncbi:MAG: hypothetical protein VKK59_05340, partial [Vampirovibrionales bacterium]|nr:hypothetical protein [Vampirovibrionales bacterium]